MEECQIVAVMVPTLSIQVVTGGTLASRLTHNPHRASRDGNFAAGHSKDFSKVSSSARCSTTTTIRPTPTASRAPSMASALHWPTRCARRASGNRSTSRSVGRFMRATSLSIPVMRPFIATVSSFRTRRSSRVGFAICIWANERPKTRSRGPEEFEPRIGTFFTLSVVCKRFHESSRSALIQGPSMLVAK